MHPWCVIKRCAHILDLHLVCAAFLKKIKKMFYFILFYFATYSNILQLEMVFESEINKYNFESCGVCLSVPAGSGL